MKEDKSIRIAEKSYKILLQLKNKTGAPIKTVIQMLLTGNMNVHGHIRKPYQTLPEIINDTLPKTNARNKLR